MCVYMCIFICIYLFYLGYLLVLVEGLGTWLLVRGSSTCQMNGY